MVTKLQNMLQGRWPLLIFMSQWLGKGKAVVPFSFGFLLNIVRTFDLLVINVGLVMPVVNKCQGKSSRLDVVHNLLIG